MVSEFDESRVRILNKGTKDKGHVLYWMSREQRIHHNWALLYAQRLAVSQKSSLAVVFALVPDFLNASARHYVFMLENLKYISAELKSYNIPFYLLMGDPPEVIDQLCGEHEIAHVITDFDPLKIKRQWKNRFCVNNRNLHVYEVDAHNVVPCWIASAKEEHAAYTFRPKIKKHLKRYLTSYPELEAQKQNSFGLNSTDWERVTKYLPTNNAEPLSWINSGEKHAHEQLDHFIQNKFHRYGNERNDPNADVQSGLSPYLHFGHISAQHIAAEILKRYGDNESTGIFLEELIVRKELSDNYCYYNPNYDNPAGIKPWAMKSLSEHEDDKRDYVYTPDEFEKAMTHEELWNAAQTEMIKRGKMHGYLRMYWAKKILEWTSSVTRAYQIAVYLNDKYQLDGRDPNGYTGIAWSIGGIHDRAWAERSVFGKIRYMNLSGCRRKFDVDRYIFDVGQI